MLKKKNIEIKNIQQLFEIVNSGYSVVYNIKNNWIIYSENEKEIYYKLWQLEKINENEYCYKEFDNYNKAIKSFFTLTDLDLINIQQLRLIIRKISYYIQISNIELEIFLGKYMKEEIEKKCIINYKKEKISQDNYKYNIFKTRQKKSSNKSGEEEIRKELNSYIEKKYPNGIRHDEYTTAGMNSRADSVVFNKDFIHTYEIKSEKDSFTRLEEQIKSYKTYSEYITIVLDIKKKNAFLKNHYKKYQDIEILIFDRTKDKLEILLKGKKLKPTTDKLNLLWKNELSEQVLNFISNKSKLNKGELEEVVAFLFTKKQAQIIVNEIIYDRHNKSKNNTKYMLRGNINMNEVLKKFKIDKEKLKEKSKKIKYLQKKKK